jgi:hypothetical protein
MQKPQSEKRNGTGSLSFLSVEETMEDLNAKDVHKAYNSLLHVTVNICFYLSHAKLSINSFKCCAYKYFVRKSVT